MTDSDRGARYWIDALDLSPHPEGGFYKEIYRSPVHVSEDVLPGRYGSSRSFMTSIFFLLTEREYSKFHRLRSDELWCHQAGGAVALHTLDPEGDCRITEVGPGVDRGQLMQVSVPGNTWLAAEVQPGGDYALVACVVSPGFEFEDFELASAEELAEEFPGQRSLIERLT